MIDTPVMTCCCHGGTQSGSVLVAEPYKKGKQVGTWDKTGKQTGWWLVVALEENTFPR